MSIEGPGKARPEMPHRKRPMRIAGLCWTIPTKKNHFLLSRGGGGLRRRLRWGMNLFSGEEANMVTPYNLGRDTEMDTHRRLTRPPQEAFIWNLGVGVGEKTHLPPRSVQLLTQTAGHTSCFVQVPALLRKARPFPP